MKLGLLPDDATVAKNVGEAWPVGIAEHSVATASALTVSSGEAESARPGEKADARVAAVARPAGGARPHGISKQGATTKPELADGAGEAGSHWSTAGGTTTAAAAAAVANSAGGVRPPGFAKHRATTESGVGVRKMSCQGKVKVGKKKIPQERDPERQGEQSRV